MGNEKKMHIYGVCLTTIKFILSMNKFDRKLHVFVVLISFNQIQIYNVLLDVNKKTSAAVRPCLTYSHIINVHCHSCAMWRLMKKKGNKEIIVNLED